MPLSLSIAIANPIRRAAGAVHGVLRSALDLALPQLCPACRETVEGRGLCASCWSKLSFITRPYCERLGIPFVYDPGPGILSMEAIADPPSYNRARAAVRFDEISRALVHAPEIWRPARPRADDGTLGRAGRARASGQRRCAGAGAAALAAAMGTALQPIGHAGGHDFRRKRRAHCSRRAQAGQSRPRSKSACRGPSAATISKARFVCRRRARPRSPADGWSWSMMS